ncbi:related to transporter protein [Phialocephala subalpina]|uniref:Related to transporter protein n=1 Tax=Phialocephala subalpina TaxID=576137 RepID=A0A1L7XPA3_9HELO|nr:related to transporter protein [Phialocephala subalpina]
MSESKEKRTVLGVFKDIFNWYPSEYPSEERNSEVPTLDSSPNSLPVFSKFLDQSNINNAYVSGMKEELKLYGNELNYFNVMYYTAYVVSQVPLLLLLSRPKLARWGLPILEVIWGVLTFCQSKVTNVNQLYALRFLVGVAEAPVFAGTHFILGSWYKRSELFKRAGTWFLCNALGTMFSGYLQAAAYTNLNGVGGLSGWRWLFIIDGIITIPIAFIGFTVFPGIPSSPKPFYFKNREIELARKRMRDNRTAPAGPITLDVFKRSAKRWHIWVFMLAYICMINCSYPSGYMSLWLKQEKFSVPMINKLPTVISGISVLSSWLGTTLAAIYPPWVIYAIPTIAGIFSSICMTVWNIPRGLKFVAWYAYGLQGCISPILYSVVNDILKDDAEERALVISSMMTAGYSTYIWVPLLLFPTVDAPQWKKGWPTGIAFYSALFGLFVLSLVWHRRDERRKGETTQINEVESLESGEEGFVGKGDGGKDTAIAVSDISRKN